MSLFYKCDCCGSPMHMLGDNNGKRLHLDVGELMDDAQNSVNKRTSWNIEEHPLVSLDLCPACYNDLCAKICSLRIRNQLSTTLEEVSIGGASV